MKRILFSALPHAALCYGSVLASLFCTITAFSLPVAGRLLWGMLAVFALVWSLVFTLPKRGVTVPLALAAQIGLFLLQWEQVLAGARRVLEILLSHWSNCYSWCPEIHFAQLGGAADVAWFFLFLGALAVVASLFGLFRCGSCLLSVLVTLPCFFISITIVNLPPATEAFVCLLALLILLALTQSVRAADLAAAGRLSLLLGIPVALFCVLLFALKPTQGYQRGALPDRLLKLFSGESFEEYYQRVNSGSGGIVGTVTQRTVDFSTLGALRQSGATVMSVNTPTDQTLYLRGVSMGDYTVTGWAADSGTAPLYPDLSETSAVPVTIRTQQLADVVYLPYYCLDLPTGQLSDDGSAENTDAAREYTLSVVPPLQISDIASASHPFASGFQPMNAYTQLPDSTRAAMYSLALEKGMLAYDDVYTTAQAVAEFYRTNGVYTLTPELVPDGEDFAVWFTTESMHGYCVHYATAATAMLRALNIPARYVTGYHVDAVGGEDTSVTGLDAHAWVEYYLNGFGWVPLEVTPSSEGDPASPSGATDAPTLPSGATTPQPDSPQQDTQAPAPNAPQQPVSRWHWWYALILAPLLLFVAVMLRQRLIRAIRKRRMAAAAPNRRAELLWSAVLRIARHSGRSPDKTMEQLALKARFSNHILTSSELAALHKYEREFRRQALAGMPRAKRFCANWLWVL